MKLFKSIDRTATALTNTTVALAETAEVLVVGVRNPIVNTLIVAENATKSWINDSEFDIKRNDLVNSARIKALKSIADSEELQKQLEKAELASILDDLDL